METEHDHDQFEKVQKLLALKRYELPPPGYFNGFSGKIIARIHALEASRPATWRQRLGLDFDFKPALMGAFGVAVCGLLLVSVINSSGISSGNMTVANDPSAMFGSPVGDPAFAAGMNFSRVSSQDVPASTVPVSGTPSSDSPFGRFTPQAQPAGFIFGE
jgi:hypothetical protein